MLDTPSLFEAMEQDVTTQRVASRRALALAHKRVETHLGNFLRGAQSEEEFLERLALVQDDFAGYVHMASNEVGHPHPDHIAAALIDHYRLAAGPPQFEDVDEGEDEDDESDSKPFKIPGKGSHQASAGSPAEWRVEAHTVSGWTIEAGVNAQPPMRAMSPDPMAGATATEGDAFDAGFGGLDSDAEAMVDELAMQYEQQGMPYEQALAKAHQELTQHNSPGLGGGQPPMRGQMQSPGTMASTGGPFLAPEHTAANPSEQTDTSPDKVTCPECGGNGKTANNSTCRKCRGAGKVPNFGDSMVDNVGANYSRTADSGNTGLAGPEPKIDKAEWTRSNPGKPSYDDKIHPTKEKDIIEPIVMTNRDQDGHDLSEIGDIESVELDTAGDEPFGTGGEDFGPHTKTFPNDGQTNPVTRETMGSTNPLAELLSGDFPAPAVIQAAFAKRR